MAVVWPSKNNFIDGDVLTAANVNNIADTLNVFNPTAATNGQVWLANGSGSGAYTTLSTGAFTSLASGSLPTGTGTLTLSSISADYQWLRLMLIGWSSTASSELTVRINNISTSTYHTGYFYWVVGPGGAYTQNQIGLTTSINAQNFGSTTAGTITHVLDFPTYSRSTKQMCVGYCVGDATGGGGQGIGYSIGHHNAAVIINRIDCILNTGNYDAGTYVLYGIK